MLGRVVLLSSLALSLSLAGCLKGDEPGEKHVVATPPLPLPGPEPPVPCADCGDPDIPPAPGPGGVMHSHDYWGGETRKVVASFDSGLIPIPLIPDGKAPGTAIADYDVPKGSLVYEGTSSLEVTFEKVCVLGTDPGWVMGGPHEGCAAAHPFITLQVDYLTAADEPGAFRSAGAATPGVPLVIPVAPTEADMPHQTKSLWLFRIYTGEANAFTYNVTITAVKGGAVVAWPPHPDVYAQGPSRVVLDGEFRTSSKGLVDYYLYGSDANWVYADRVISYGTETVDVEVTLGTLTAPGGAQPTEYYLDHKNASFLSKVGNGDMSGGRLVDPASDGTTFRFRVPVDPEGYDTPYGSKSRWGFRFMARFGEESQCPEVDASLQQGCQVVPYELTYAMRVVAAGRPAAVPDEGAGFDGAAPATASTEAPGHA